MKKCRYSFNGKCTNDEVACDICSSSVLEMEACAPFQHSKILRNEDWTEEPYVAAECICDDTGIHYICPDC